jgi:hypothetical protein
MGEDQAPTVPPALATTSTVGSVDNIGIRSVRRGRAGSDVNPVLKKGGKWHKARRVVTRSVQQLTDAGAFPFVVRQLIIPTTRTRPARPRSLPSCPQLSSSRSSRQREMRLTKRTFSRRTIPVCKFSSTNRKTISRTFHGVRQSHALTICSKIFYGRSLLELDRIDQSEQVTVLPLVFL